MPWPAVSHCTSPPPKRAVAPSESEWSMRPWRTIVTVSKPRCGCCGKARHHVAVVHAPAVLALEVLADVAAGERGRGPEPLVAAGIGVVVVHAEQERIRGFPGKPRGLTASIGSSPSARDVSAAMGGELTTAAGFGRSAGLQTRSCDRLGILRDAIVRARGAAVNGRVLRDRLVPKRKPPSMAATKAMTSSVVALPLREPLFRGARRLRIALVGMPNSGKSTFFAAVASTSVQTRRAGGHAPRLRRMRRADRPGRGARDRSAEHPLAAPSGVGRPRGAEIPAVGRRAPARVAARAGRPAGALCAAGRHRAGGRRHVARASSGADAEAREIRTPAGDRAQQDGRSRRARHLRQRQGAERTAGRAGGADRGDHGARHRRAVPRGGARRARRRAPACATAEQAHHRRARSRSRRC